MEKLKENAKTDWLKMIDNSWTWKRLTDNEKSRFLDVIEQFKEEGSYKKRWEYLQAMYYSFLLGCGYKPSGWRETEENIPEF